jgi:ketosteroid isomerase-like protein
MAEENVEVVERAIAAVNDRDLEGYFACCTEDIELRTPLASIGGVYEGQEDIRRFFADLEDTSPDFRLDVERMEAISQDRILALMHVTATGRASGIPTPAATANLYDLVDGKIRRVRIFLDRQQALEAAGLSE